MRRFTAVLLAAALALTACTRGTSPQTLTLYSDGRRAAAPDLSGELLTGGAFDPGTVRGRVVVVNFWASWCAPCRAEADDLEKTYQQVRAKGVAFVGVNTRDGRDEAKAFLVGRATYPSLVDPAGRVALRFDVPPNFIPSTIIIDRRGRVAAVIHRPIVQTELQPLVEALAAEPDDG